MPLSFLVCSLTLLAQTPQDAPERFETLPGLAVRTWAPAEHAGGALAIDIDIRGRIWALQVRDGVRVSILDDSDGDGSCDAVRVYRQWSDAKSAGGLAVLGERVFASVDGRIVGLSDSDGDGAADTEATWIHQSVASVDGGFVGGPDGKCWFASSPVSSSVSTGASNEVAGFKVFGADWDGQGVARRAARLGRAHEVALDSFGNLFASTHADAGAVRTLLCPYEFEGDTSQHAAGDPRGLVVYESAFIPELDGALLVADAGAGAVLALRNVRHGAGSRSSASTFLAPKRSDAAPSADFRPVDVAVGIDGAVFVVDGGAAGASEILRVGPAGRRNALPQLRLNVLNGQLSALLSPAVNVRASAFELLEAEGEAAFEPLQGVAKARNPRWQARALWLLAGAGTRGRMFVREHLSHENEDLRLVALRALLARGEVAAELARRFVGDPSLALRAEALHSLATTPWDAKAAIVLDLIAPWPAGDAAFVEAAVRAVSAEPGDAAKLREALAAEASQPKPRWKADEIAELVARLPRAGAEK
jgi:hypothetical protein